jgi:hypothetical protein
MWFSILNFSFQLLLNFSIFNAFVLKLLCSSVCCRQAVSQLNRYTCMIWMSFIKIPTNASVRENTSQLIVCSNNSALPEFYRLWKTRNYTQHTTKLYGTKWQFQKNKKKKLGIKMPLYCFRSKIEDPNSCHSCLEILWIEKWQHDDERHGNGKVDRTESWIECVKEREKAKEVLAEEE